MNNQTVTSLTNDYKYITMIHTKDKPKTVVFDVYTKHGETYLGELKWYAPWRQYCYFPEDDCVFSKGCLADINDFIEKLMTQRTERRSSNG